MSEFGGLHLQKHEKTQHTLVGLGSAALASHTQIRRPKFSERDKKMYNKQSFQEKKFKQSIILLARATFSAATKSSLHSHDLIFDIDIHDSTHADDLRCKFESHPP